MKKLLVYLKGYGKESVLAPLFKLLEAFFELLVPLVMAGIIDRGIGGADFGYIGKMGVCLLTLGIVGLISSVTAQFFAAKAAVGFSEKLRQSLFDHIQGLNFTNLDKAGAPTLITRMTSDINQVQSGVNMVLRLFLRSPVIVFGAIIMAFTIDVKSALVFVAAIPLLAIVVFGIMMYTIPLYRKVQSSLDKVLGITRENLTGARVIRAFHQEEREEERFRDSNRRLADMQMFVGRISAVMNPLTYVIVNGAIIALIYVGAVQVNTGHLTQGQVVAIINYMSQILVELVKLANLIVTITKALACADRVAAVFEITNDAEEQSGNAPQTQRVQGTEPLPPNPASRPGARQPVPAVQPGARQPVPAVQPGARQPVPTAQPGARQPVPAVQPDTRQPVPVVQPDTRQPVPAVQPGTQQPNPASRPAVPYLQFDQVSLTYQRAGAETLHNISFAVERGETVGIIGGTGSGKTSLVNLIPRFYPATEGTIFLEGRDIRELPDEQLRSRIGVVPQKAVLFKGTIRSNLQWGKQNATDEELWEALDTAQAREVVESKNGGLDAEVSQSGKNFSGGQKQRLTIARALVRKPDILILDDSASALDYATDAKLRGALKHSLKNAATFIVSQRASAILYADRIIVLDDGEIAGIGTHKELLKGCSVYQEIYYSQYPGEKQDAAGTAAGSVGEKQDAAGTNAGSVGEKQDAAGTAAGSVGEKQDAAGTAAGSATENQGIAGKISENDADRPVSIRKNGIRTKKEAEKHERT